MFYESQESNRAGVVLLPYPHRKFRVRVTGARVRVALSKCHRPKGSRTDWIAVPISDGEPVGDLLVDLRRPNPRADLQLQIEWRTISGEVEDVQIQVIARGAGGERGRRDQL